MDIATYISDIFQNMLNVLQSITVFDILDILLLTALIFMLLYLLKKTRAEQLIKGIIFMALFFILAQFLQLRVMSYLLENFFQVGIIAILIVFQPELRRILEHVGNVGTNLYFDSEKNTTGSDAERDNAIDEITQSLLNMRDNKIGAIIVIERNTKLDDIIEKGYILDARISEPLLTDVFYNGSPLHDLAAIVRNNKIYAAKCALPLTEKATEKKMGSRHRAAVGMSENSDALVLVVSEETGIISCAIDGQLTKNLSENSIKKILENKMPREVSKKNRLFKKTKQKTADNAEK